MRRVRLLRRQRGQALVEFALVAVVFIILVIGMIDVGRAVWNYNALAEATREGTRYAIVHGSLSTDPSGPGSSHYTAPSTDTKVKGTVQQFATGLDPSQLTVQAQWLDGDNKSGSRVKVTSGYSFRPVLNFFGTVSFSMSSSSTMNIAN